MSKLSRLSSESVQIERVQKCALHVILGDKYETYDQATKTLSVEKLHERRRRQKFSLTFAKKCEKNDKYQPSGAGGHSLTACKAAQPRPTYSPQIKNKAHFSIVILS